MVFLEIVFDLCFELEFVEGGLGKSLVEVGVDAEFEDAARAEAYFEGGGVIDLLGVGTVDIEVL